MGQPQCRGSWSFASLATDPDSGTLPGFSPPGCGGDVAGANPDHRALD